MPEIVRFGCSHCRRIESGTAERGPLSPECGIYPGCMERIYTGAEVKAILSEHYLAGVECDHDTARDRPSCSCSLVDLGWHPSVGEAVGAWADHALASSEERPRA